MRLVSLAPHLPLRGVNAVWNICDSQCDIDVRRDFNQCGTIPMEKEKEETLDWLHAHQQFSWLARATLDWLLRYFRTGLTRPFKTTTIL